MAKGKAKAKAQPAATEDEDQPKDKKKKNPSDVAQKYSAAKNAFFERLPGGSEAECVLQKGL